MKNKRPSKFKRILWRLQFIKVKWTYDKFDEGRCIRCDAGNPVECDKYGCPCEWNQQLKRFTTFKFLYK